MSPVLVFPTAGALVGGPPQIYSQNSGGNGCHHHEKQKPKGRSLRVTHSICRRVLGENTSTQMDGAILTGGPGPEC
jgi:hypothetical protein